MVGFTRWRSGCSPGRRVESGSTACGSWSRGPVDHGEATWRMVVATQAQLRAGWGSGGAARRAAPAASPLPTHRGSPNPPPRAGVRRTRRPQPGFARPAANSRVRPARRPNLASSGSSFSRTSSPEHAGRGVLRAPHACHSRERRPPSREVGGDKAGREQFVLAHRVLGGDRHLRVVVPLQQALVEQPAALPLAGDPTREREAAGRWADAGLRDPDGVARAGSGGSRAPCLTAATGSVPPT